MLEGYQERRKESWLQTVWSVVTICNATGHLRYPLRVDRIMRRLGFLGEEGQPPDPDAGRNRAERLASLAKDIEAGNWTRRGITHGGGDGPR